MSVMKGINEDSLIKWVRVLIKTEEAWHRAVSRGCLIEMCKAELDFIHAWL